MAISATQYPLDYKAIMTEGLPPLESYAYPKMLGNRVWGILHGLSHHYGCSTCRPDFELMIDGIHDLTNVKVGAPIHNKERMMRFVAMANDAAGRISEHVEDYAAMKSGYVPDEAFQRVLPVTSENVLKAVSHYVGEYKAPASISDLQFLLSIPHHSPVDKAIDKALTKAPPNQVRGAVADLERRGFVRVTENGGWVLTEKGTEELKIKDGGGKNAQGLNEETTINDSDMKHLGDVGTIVGASALGEGTTLLVNSANTSMGLNSAPLHSRLTTYVPILGAGLVIYSALKMKGERHKAARLGTLVYGSSLLMTGGASLYQQATTPGVQFGLVSVPRAVATVGPSAVQPGYIAGRRGGVGGRRDLF